MARISSSICSSFASGIFIPSCPKIFTPLSSYGLCDAEIEMPASASEVRQRYATPGVGMTPMNVAFPPPAAMPAERARAMSGPDWRVSMPMMTCFFSSRCASASPRAYIVAESSGYCDAFPRMPSVPNRTLIFFRFLLGGRRRLALRVGRYCRHDLLRHWHGDLGHERFNDPNQRRVRHDGDVLHNGGR